MSVVVDKKNKKNNTIKGFNKISSDSFPFACYFDKKTIVTKNGETMQTIAITCQDNNANINGILSENIKNAIQSALGQEYFDYSFWVHSVKINDESIAEIKNSEFGNPIYQLIKNDWEYYQKTFDNYMVVTFVTFIKISMSLKISPSNLMLFLNKSLLYNVHNTFIKRSSSLLNGVVNKVINQLQQYNVKRLEIIKTDEGYNSEHLAFWDRIVNFGNCEYGVPVADLSEVINRSLYKFDNNILSLKNNTDFFYFIK
jgi:type IV secretion system protein VirB4